MTNYAFNSGSDLSSIISADFNGDGNADLAATNPLYKNVSVLLGNGSGSFTAAPNSPFTVGYLPVSIISVDFNSDGKADLATANLGSDDISVLLGNGAGSFTAAPNSPVAVGFLPFSVTSADFNGDGKADLVATNTYDSTVSVLFGNDSIFTPAPGSPFRVGANPRSVISADFNGDSKADIATANANDNTVSILINQLSKSSLTGRSSPVNSFSLTAYPNPTTGNVTINSPEAGQVVVYNTIGELVTTQSVQAGNTTIVLGNVPTGIYTVIVTGQNNTYTPVKIIKN